MAVVVRLNEGGMSFIRLLLVAALFTLMLSPLVATRNSPGGGKVPLGVSRASVKKSLANKHLAGPKTTLNPRQEEVEKKLQKAKKKLQQIDLNGGDAKEKYSENSRTKKNELTESIEPLFEEKRKVTLKDLLRMKRSPKTLE